MLDYYDTEVINSLPKEKPDWKQFVKPECLIDLIIVPDGNDMMLTESEKCKR